MPDPVHRLVAIMFTDIVGYTAITQQSETEAVRQVDAHRRILEDSVEKHGGEILQYYGDGSLTIFHSAVDAVDTAIEIQRTLTLDRKMQLRIGIHLGEILFHNDKFLGDGINIASRIQNAAEPGQILVSAAIAEVISNKDHLSIESIGERRFKNVENKIQLYTITRQHDTLSQAVSQHQSSSSSKTRLKWISGGIIVVLAISLIVIGSIWKTDSSAKKTLAIAVLPFSSNSDDREDIFFNEGLADEIRTGLATTNLIEVRSRASSAFVRDQKFPVPQIAKELDIEYILEGRVNTTPTSGIEFNIALIDAKSDKLLETIVIEAQSQKEILSAQADIIQRVLTKTGNDHIPIINEQNQTTTTLNFDAHRSYLLGRAYLLRTSSPDDLRKSEEHFRNAIREDSLYAEAYAGLAEILILPAAWGYARLSEVMPAAREAAEKAIQLKPNIAETQHIIGTIYEFEQKFELAEQCFDRAITLDPSMALSHLRLSRVLSAQLEHDQAIKHAEAAAKLDPLTPNVLGLKATLLSRAGRNNEAVISANKFLNQFPGDNDLLWVLGAAQANNGNYELASQTLLSRPVKTAKYNFMLGYSYGKLGKKAEAKEILEYLIERHESGYAPPAMIAAVYYGMGDMAATQQWLSIEENYFFKMFAIFRPLWHDQEFYDIYNFLQKN